MAAAHFALAPSAVISAEIEAVFREHMGFYRYPRIHQELRAADGLCGGGEPAAAVLPAPSGKSPLGG